MNTESTIVEDVRRRALEISACYGHDLRAYAKHLKEIEGQHPNQTVGQVRVVRDPVIAAAPSEVGSLNSQE